MISLLNLLAQVPTGPIETTTVSETHNVLTLLWQANFIVQITILLLLFFSVVCWAIIISKHRQLKKSEGLTQDFLSTFAEAPRLEEMQLRKSQKEGPAYHMYALAKQILETPHLKHREATLARKVRQGYEEELEAIEYGVAFLATTASAAPFIGLFGTVWGILTAFWKIGQAGASSLSVVGPHIAEALIATAVGLAAAIPAAIFYNVFVSRIRRFSKDLEDFSDDLIDRVKQEYSA